MTKAKTSTSSKSSIKIRPALNPQAEENQCIALAVDCARQQLIDGTASSQVIVHFLKLGTERERLERERLAEENKLLRAKTESLQAQKRMDELYLDAIAAMKRYSGNGGDEEYEEDY